MKLSIFDEEGILVLAQLAVNSFEFTEVKNERGTFIEARFMPDDKTPAAVYGDWNGDGVKYWEACAHCFLPLMNGPEERPF